MPKEDINVEELSIEEAQEYIIHLQTPEGIVECINSLSVNDKKALAKLARTDDDGIKAYTAVNYGA